jgi:hypothetical protein
MSQGGYELIQGGIHTWTTYRLYPGLDIARLTYAQALVYLLIREGNELVEEMMQRIFPNGSRFLRVGMMSRLRP